MKLRVSHDKHISKSITCQMPNQMPNIWHLAHQTPKTNPHQAFQTSKILVHRYSIISNMRRYGQKLQKYILLFYLLFLSPHHRYPSLSLSLSSLFLFHNTSITKGHHSTPPIICLLSPLFLSQTLTIRHITLHLQLASTTHQQIAFIARQRSPWLLARDHLRRSPELAFSTLQVARISSDSNAAHLRQHHLLLAKQPAAQSH